MITEGAIVEAKATNATDIFMRYHYPVYGAVYALSRGCTCIASPVSFPRFSVRPWSESTRIVVQSASNSTYTLQRQSCIVTLGD